MNDQEILSDIQDALTWDVRVDARNISVGVENGVVTLNGTVDTYAQKLDASQIVSRIKGVTDVVNNLIVRPAIIRSDEEIRQDIDGALRRDVLVDETNIMVEVSNGIAILNGSVATIAEKNAAESDAWLTPGITDVINNIVVTPAVARMDQEIEEDVRAGLARDTRIDMRNIDIEVVDAVVYLRGVVEDFTQKWIASDIAWWTPGVRDVINKLTVRAAA
ncbi:MAG: BON domain-containing protein [Actinobacteria bacterium]|nr:BON domain-containing protein [Actinomycetota bacterium]